MARRRLGEGYLTSFSYEIGYLRAGVSALEDYLLSHELYWPLDANALPGERPYPELTLGGILLARTRAWAYPKSLSHQAELQNLDEQIEAEKNHWRVAWGKKASRSFQARLKLWGDYLDETIDKPVANADRFAYEVERRVMLHLLSPETENLPQAYRDMLAALDLRLRGVFHAGEFIWYPQISSGFPTEEYWYLYGTLLS